MLERWKSALEKHGIKWDGGDDCLFVFLPSGNLCLFPDDDDLSSAEFRERVAQHVFGEWAYFEPGNEEPEFSDGEWPTMPTVWLVSDQDDFSLGSGPSKNDALLDALEKKDVE